MIVNIVDNTGIFAGSSTRVRTMVEVRMIANIANNTLKTPLLVLLLDQWWMLA